MVLGTEQTGLNIPRVETNASDSTSETLDATEPDEGEVDGCALIRLTVKAGRFAYVRSSNSSARRRSLVKIYRTLPGLFRANAARIGTKRIRSS